MCAKISHLSGATPHLGIKKSNLWCWLRSTELDYLPDTATASLKILLPTLLNAKQQNSPYFPTTLSESTSL